MENIGALYGCRKPTDLNSYALTYTHGKCNPNGYAFPDRNAHSASFAHTDHHIHTAPFSDTNAHANTSSNCHPTPNFDTTADRYALAHGYVHASMSKEWKPGFIAGLHSEQVTRRIKMVSDLSG